MNDRPLLHVVRGDPSEEELAALVTLLRARSAAADAADRPMPRSAWADPARRLRAPVAPGPGAWRRSGLPG